MLAYEVLTAFFLEAGFLGVALFGWNKVGPALHFFATLMVALGTLVSATWILASNSWMQTPAGFTIEGGRVIPVDWLAVIFNPSFPYRLAHMTIAAYLATALFVGASGAWHLLRGNNTARVRAMLSMAMWMTVIVAPIQIEAGDQHGLNTLQYQPEKIAAIEGHWRNKPGEAVPLILFGWPDMATETTKYAVEIPHLGSAHPDPYMGRTVSRPRRFPRQRPAEFDDGVLDLPDHGRARLPDARRSASGASGSACAATSTIRACSCVSRGDGPFRPPRHPRWMVYDRDRAPALGRLWRHAHQRRRLQSFGAGAHHLARRCSSSMYFIVFGTGIFYILKLVAVGPQDTGRSSRAAATSAATRRSARPRAAFGRAGRRTGDA